MRRGRWMSAPRRRVDPLLGPRARREPDPRALPVAAPSLADPVVAGAQATTAQVREALPVQLPAAAPRLGPPAACRPGVPLGEGGKVARAFGVVVVGDAGRGVIEPSPGRAVHEGPAHVESPELPGAPPDRSAGYWEDAG